METTTADISLSYTTSGYTNSWAHNQSWCKKPEHYDTLIVSAVSFGISLCGLVGNGIVMWVLIFHMKQNPFIVYVLNLTIADFSLLLIHLLFHTLEFISFTYCIMSFPFKLTDYILFILLHFCYFSSMNLLTALSFERCLAALFPIWYRCHRPKHLSGIVCGVLWALAAIFVSLILITCHFKIHCEQLLHALSTINFLAFSVFPLVSNLALFIKLRCGSQRRHPGKLYVAILLSLICLFICGLPFSLEFLINPTNLSLFYTHVCFLLASLNSSINPVIYFLVGSCRQRQFQCSVKVAFRRLFEEKATSEERSQVPGETAVETSV